MKLRFSIRILLITALLAVRVSIAAPPDKLQEPHLEGDKFVEVKFGDDEIVSHLGGLLDDPDPVVREQAVMALGATNNQAAFAHLRKAMQDEDIGVRVAGVEAAVELGGDQAAPTVLDALEAKETPMLMVGMRKARKMNLSAAAPKVRLLLSSEDELVRAVALSTLTRLGQPAPPSQLKKLLNAPSRRVRLRAAENAYLLAQPASIIDDLMRAAEEPNPPPLRAAGLEALSKHAFGKAGKLLAAAEKDSNPLLVRSALRAYHLTGRAELVRPFLDHPSAMVRLAAMRAAADLKIASAVERLFELMLEATDKPTHLTARRALREIGGESVPDGAAGVMHQQVEALEKLRAGKKPTKADATLEPDSEARDTSQLLQLHLRNISSCNWLVGELKSKKALKLQLKILTATLDKNSYWTIDSPVLLELAPALGKIGDQRAVDPLLKVLKKCVVDGVRHLRAMIQMRIGPPYSEEVTGKIIQALGKLKVYSAADTVKDVATTNVQGSRVSRAASYAYRTLHLLVRQDNRSKIESCIAEGLTPEYGHSMLARFHAVKAAGRLKIKTAVPSLREMLTGERPGRRSMHAAAWALQEITGKTPRIPQPRIRQGDWILKKVSE